MSDSKTGNINADNATLFISAQGLKGRQSVRATFKLPEYTINLLGIVASQLGIKQKSLFDQLVDDKVVLTEVAEQARDTVYGREARLRCKTAEYLP